MSQTFCLMLFLRMLDILAHILVIGDDGNGRNLTVIQTFGHQHFKILLQDTQNVEQSPQLKVVL